MSFLAQRSPGKTQVGKLRLGIIGCGAVTEQSHLPAALACNRVELTALVDKNLSRAENLAKRLGVPHVSQDYTDIFDEVDAAILALPHVLHAPVSIDFLNHGIPVLVEKPMALNTAECDAMIAAAQQNGVSLAVGLVRRFRHTDQFIKTLIDGGFLGKIESFDVREGTVYNWQIASDFEFRKEMGGGVLMDTGAHPLDTILWWFGDYESLNYFDDNMGGVEADCEIHVKMKNGIKGFVDLSRTRNLRNTIVIKSKKAIVEVHVYRPQISIQPQGLQNKIAGYVVGSDRAELKAQSAGELFTAQLENWVDAIQNKQQPWVNGKEAQKSVALIEACYQNRKPLEEPWRKYSREKMKGESTSG